MSESHSSLVRFATDSGIGSADRRKSSANQSDLGGYERSGKTNKECNTQNSHRRLELSHVDFVPSNAQYSQGGPKFYIFEDSEAVIKMLMKGRRPHLRHVSRTHRVALDWLFDRSNLDPKIQIRYVDTKNQFADILTEGHFTRDEWNHP